MFNPYNINHSIYTTDAVVSDLHKPNTQLHNSQREKTKPDKDHVCSVQFDQLKRTSLTMCIYVFALCVTLGVALCDPKVFYPEIIRQRARRSVDGDLMEIRVMDWTLELNERDNLMVDKTIVEWVSENGTRVETLRADCEFKQGRVRGLESRSTVVATVCDGRVYGYLNVDGLGHFVEPSDESSKAHLLYSRWVF